MWWQIHLPLAVASKIHSLPHPRTEKVSMMTSLEHILLIVQSGLNLEKLSIPQMYKKLWTETTLDAFTSPKADQSCKANIFSQKPTKASYKAPVPRDPRLSFWHCEDWTLKIQDCRVRTQDLSVMSRWGQPPRPPWKESWQFSFS